MNILNLDIYGNKETMTNFVPYLPPVPLSSFPLLATSFSFAGLLLFAYFFVYVSNNFYPNFNF